MPPYAIICVIDECIYECTMWGKGYTVYADHETAQGYAKLITDRTEIIRLGEDLFSRFYPDLYSWERLQ